MSDRSIIIIGAGLAGLSAGCYAQMNGYRTRIFEQHTLPGGVCTAWERKGYTIDGCIHWLMGCKPGQSFYQFYREVGALTGNRLLPLDCFTRALDERSGLSVAFTRDLDRLAHDLKAISPQDGDAIDEMIRGAHAMRGIKIDMRKAPELQGRLDTLRQMWSIRKALRYFGQYNNLSVAEFAERFQHPFLRWAITHLFLPEMPFSFLLMVLGQLAEDELAVVEGGSLRFSEAIARHYRSLGGEIVYRACVERILVEDDRAVGVRLADGSEHRADIVISAADGYNTIFEMLEGRYVDDPIRERYTNWPLFRPLILASFGVARSFPNEPPANAIRVKQPLRIAGQDVDAFELRIFNYDASLAPPGKTVLQVLIETDFDWWDTARRDRERYRAEKKRVADEILRWLEGRYPGISAQVEMTDVATPYTFWRYTRNYRGAYEGWLMTPRMFQVHVPKTLPGLANFYMAGQWVEPGGGVPIAIYSGRNVIQLICHQERRRFVTTIADDA
ncbi:MAG: NAD(P)/FAD-dependent oxidoreductase [Chloroflexi bacterium]|nr:NAD(P)/FAD-dependent oxidoreductase [Chloroflexota bacterium]